MIRKDDNEDLAMSMALKALERVYKVFRMDEVDTIVSMEVGMSISLLKKVLEER